MAIEQSETDFQGAVVEAAVLYGWRHMHVRKAIVRDGQYATPTSVEGWPDLVLWRPRRGGLIFAELKSNEGKVSRAQREVLNSLASAGAVTAVWRPSDWHLIVEMLSGKPAGGGEAGGARVVPGGTIGRCPVNYILTFKTEPDMCGLGCPCATEYGSDEERREIKADVDFERSQDAASRYQENADG